MNEHGRTRAMPTLYAGNATGRSGCRTKTRRKRAPVLLSSFCLSSPEMFRTERRRERGGGGERERERKVGRKTTRYTHVHTPIHPSCSRRIISFDIDRVIDLESVRSFIPWIYRNTSSNERTNVGRERGGGREPDL